MRALSAVLTLSFGLVVGCGSDTSDAGAAVEGTHADAHRALLRSLADTVIVPTLTDVHERARDLATATEAWAEGGEREPAQAAWRTTMAAWQRAEVLQVGPAGRADEVAGGRDLRDAIYSWTIVNPCRVDQELVEQAYENPEAFATEAVNVRGLDALEYLLFRAGTDNDCKPNSTINTDGSWAALDAEALDQRRAAYARTAARLLEADTRTLLEAWTVEGFADKLATAGPGNAVYPAAQEALNSLSDAMFYVDTVTKDVKLAVPAGLAGCDEDVCPDALESRFAAASGAHVRENVRAFEALVVGDETRLGFADLLRSVGAETLADQVTAELGAAVEAFEALDDSLSSALATDPDRVRAAHATLKVAMDTWKTQALSVLNLSIPARAASDND